MRWCDGESEMHRHIPRCREEKRSDNASPRLLLLPLLLQRCEIQPETRTGEEEPQTCGHRVVRVQPPQVQEDTIRIRDTGCEISEQTPLEVETSVRIQLE